MILSELLRKGSIDYKPDSDIEISSIEYDSRKVMENSIFIAIEGFVTDGHKYIESAVNSGAAAVVYENPVDIPVSSATVFIKVNDSRAALSKLSSVFFGTLDSNIDFIGITGTNGKTSITYMVESVLKISGYNPGVIGTVDYRWNNEKIPAPNTTPESRDLHEIIHKMRKDGVNIVIMEVSSHGLELGRVDDIPFRIGAFTNLTRDHLDFHHDFESYFKAKRKLFDLIADRTGNDKYAVINSDDEYGKKLIDYLKNKNINVKSFSFNEDADFYAEPSRTTAAIDKVILGIKGFDESIELKVPGRFSLFNGLTAFGICFSLGIKFSDIRKGMMSLESVPGRFDRVDVRADYNVIVDYAHTNDALEKLLMSANEVADKRVITVFGCGGDRDKTKRPLMGRVAVDNSDIAIVTSDNPRTENPDRIINDILDGVKDCQKEYIVEPDRECAIKEAIYLAEPGDLVVIAGKGHEDYQILGKEKIHFDDKEVASKYMLQRQNDDRNA